MECPFKEGTEVSPTEREPSAVCVKQMTFTSWLRAPRQFRKIDKERVLGLWVMQEEYSRSSLVSGGLASGHISIHLGAGFFFKSLSKYFVNISNLIYLTLGHKQAENVKMAVCGEVCSCAWYTSPCFPGTVLSLLPPPSSPGTLSALDWTFRRLTQKGLPTMNPSHPDSAGKERNVPKWVRPEWGQTPEL